MLINFVFILINFKFVLSFKTKYILLLHKRIVSKKSINNLTCIIRGLIFFVYPDPRERRKLIYTPLGAGVNN